MTRTALILGAGSDIGIAVAHALAAEGYSLHLAGRREDGYGTDCADINLRYGVSATSCFVDALDLPSHVDFVDSLPCVPDVVVCAIGLMVGETGNAVTTQELATTIRSNFEGPASLLLAFAGRMEVRGSGVLVGISSVAGIRGRASNFGYGSAKAGFSAFLSGLRNQLARGASGVHVVTVLPGFVRTKMTKDMELPSALTAVPSCVAGAVAKSIRKRQDIVYVLPVWRFLMLIIRHIPETIFKKLSI